MASFKGAYLAVSGHMKYDFVENEEEAVEKGYRRETDPAVDGISLSEKGRDTGESALLLITDVASIVDYFMVRHEN